MSGLPAPHPEPAPAEEGLTEYNIFSTVTSTIDTVKAKRPQQAFCRWALDKGWHGYRYGGAPARDGCPIEGAYYGVMCSGSVTERVIIVPAEALECGL